MVKSTTNLFKTGLREDRRLIGIWSSLCSPISADIIAGSAIDWAVIDMEHAPNDIAGVIDQLRGYDASPVEAIVRPPWSEPVIVKRLLDGGVRNLLFPFIETADEARRMVAATRYPPEGFRGVTVSGRGSGYGRRIAELASAHENICVIVQIETAGALAQLEEIASVPGVDAVFIGPSDLSASFGHLGNTEADVVQTAIRDGVERLKAIDKPAGILCPSDEVARRYASWGFRFLSVGSDVVFIRAGVDRVASLDLSS